MEDDIHMSHMQTLKFIVTVVSLLLLLSSLPQSQCQPPPPNHYSECKDSFYNCGTTLSSISYPFWADNQRPSFCGADDNLFNLHCDHKENTTTIQIGAQEFTVKAIDTTAYTIKLVRTEVNACSQQFDGNHILSDPRLFRYPEPAIVRIISIFYNCPSIHPDDGVNNFTCGGDDGRSNHHNVTYFWGAVDDDLFMKYQWLQNCPKHIQVPVKAPSTQMDPYINGGAEALRKGLGEEFEMPYVVSPECIDCFRSGRVCGTNDHQFICYDHKTSDLNLGRKIIIGVGSAVFGAIAVFAVFYYLRRRKKNSYAKSYIQSQSFSSAPSLQDTEKGSRYFGVPLFTYTELEEATNYFDSSRELGEGGFGTVYFGKLQDGRNVAVKRLYENNYRRIEQFMNEVKILTGLVHPNLVTLYGCTSRHSRELLLVYEYVPNGTVADHLHGQKAKPGKLPWHIRMNIAVETASALKYLHISEIIHRDVKTNNILLDNHFHVKVADFGLSRLFPNAVTHISTAPQGTPGYVDPEYHECYQLTNKSDVYSFGVVLVELISSLPAVDITRHRHEINLANMAINKIHNQALHELVDPSLGFDSDPKVRKMINAVAELAFQCLQSSKDLRPSMDEVVDTLKDIQSDGKYKSQPVVLDISASAGDDVVLLKDDPPPPSPDSNAVSMSTTPNVSG